MLWTKSNNQSNWHFATVGFYHLWALAEVITDTLVMYCYIIIYLKLSGFKQHTSDLTISVLQESQYSLAESSASGSQRMAGMVPLPSSHLRLLTWFTFLWAVGLDWAFSSSQGCWPEPFPIFLPHESFHREAQNMAFGFVGTSKWKTRKPACKKHASKA
jgi:hypothetical protein